MNVSSFAIGENALPRNISSDECFPLDEAGITEKQDVLNRLSASTPDNYTKQLIELCEKNHDYKMVEMLQRFLHVVSFELGRLEVSFLKEIPEDWTLDQK